jgi:hypothetical protein
MTQLLIRGDEQFLAPIFGLVQQLAVTDVGPAHLEGGVD